MRTRYAICFVLALTALIWVYSAISDASISSNNKAAYEAYIDEVISKCELKIARCNSKSRNIRREAALSCLKAGFFSYHKDELVKEMVISDIGIREHQIHYYLNKRFFDTFRTAAKRLD